VESSDERVIAFLSDYGLADEFVGVCKSVMLATAPGTRIIDLTHEVPPHDVKAGALALVRAAQYLPTGAIVVAVVDPGVGTERRLVAAETDAATFLGPDNGLLAPAVAMVGGARRVVSLTNDELHLPSPGPTFAGRDVLSRCAGALAAGTPIEELGEPVDPASLVPGLLSLPRELDGGAIEAEVWWIDRFGNCQLNVGPEDLHARRAGRGASIEVRFDRIAKSARWVETYADAKPSELVLLVDSYGMLALALDRRSAAAEYGLHTGSGVLLVPPGTTAPEASS